MSSSFCRLSQSCADVPSALASRSAVSAVMAVCSLAIRSIRVRGKAQTLVKSVRRHFDRNEELLPQNLTGMHGLELLGHVASFRRPNKAHPESIVNVDRVLPLAIARERLKAIAKKRPQVAKI